MPLRFPLATRRTRWLLVGVVAGALLVGSVVHLPSSPGPAGPSPVPTDKLEHFVGYAALAAAVGYAVVDADRPRWRLAVFVVVAAVGYGLALELVQATIPYRSFSLLDLLADGAGAGAAVACYALIEKAGLLAVELQRSG
ncbi:MAG: VanZ family protein [Haloarculaceae archaeon]